MISRNFNCQECIDNDNVGISEYLSANSLKNIKNRKRYPKQRRRGYAFFWRSKCQGEGNEIGKKVSCKACCHRQPTCENSQQLIPCSIKSLSTVELWKFGYMHQTSIVHLRVNNICANCIFTHWILCKSYI